MINLIYILPSEKGPTGGIKVAAQHSKIINELKKNILCKTIFIKKKKISKWKSSINKLISSKQKKNARGWEFNQIVIDKNNKTKWFDNNISIKNDFNFDKNRNFIILPEIFAHFAKDLLIKNNINYAIFVQNGHALNFTSDHSALNLAYTKAKFILTVSSHINRCVKIAFPERKNKIFKINQYIKNHKINYKLKSRIITYMPRKLPDHSKLVLFFLKKYLPKNWKIVRLENMSEHDVIKNLIKSKIFLSFSNLEGFGLPPLEAATLGNIVIGYTGQAGNEYWNSPIFKKIEQGDILNFVEKINSTIKKEINYSAINIHKKKLLKNYSKKNQEKQILEILKRIKIYF